MRVKKEKVCGYVDLNNTELKKLHSVDIYYSDGALVKSSSNSKRFIEQFCNKLNRAKVYEILLREVK